jgi:ParB family chromosome partitioning protein
MMSSPALARLRLALLTAAATTPTDEATEAVEAILEREFGDDAQGKVRALMFELGQELYGLGDILNPDWAATLTTLKNQFARELGEDTLSTKKRTTADPPLTGRQKKAADLKALRAMQGGGAYRDPTPRAPDDDPPAPTGITPLLEKATAAADAKKAGATQEPLTLLNVSLELLPRRELVPWPGLNPRHTFDDAALDDLAESIRARGIQAPLGVRKNPSPPHYVFAGERRLRAAEIVGLELVPCAVQDISEAAAFEGALLENMQRADLSPIEEAKGLQRYLKHNPALTQEEVGKVFGYGQAWVANRLRLLRLPAAPMSLLVAGEITATSARDWLVPFIGLRDAHTRGKLYKAILKKVSSEPGSRPLPDHRVQYIVTQAAIRLSNALAIEADGDWHASVVNPVTRAMHESCSCGGPRLQYDRQTTSAEHRCFDTAWWTQAAQRARAERAAAVEAAREAVRAASESPAPGVHPSGAGAVVGLPVAPALRPPRRQAVFVWYGEDPRLWATPELLDPSGFEIQEGAVYWTGDPALYEAATADYRRRLSEHTQTFVQAELELLRARCTFPIPNPPTTTED